MEYVIKNPRLREYLYKLGFDYREVSDKTGKQDYVWLFKNTTELLEAITFYTTLKNKLKISKNTYTPKI
ncbi:hypothetical protein HMPREF1982_03532 [Clostridiales bacterium oral taxon 876 str. F0540]|nr:hypothetical protein HMPREF1982_03532 [Clostridiales bacterium oral taxon 876 str. F0540]